MLKTNNDLRVLIERYLKCKSSIFDITHLRDGENRIVKVIFNDGYVETVTGTKSLIIKFNREFRRSILNIKI